MIVMIRAVVQAQNSYNKRPRRCEDVFIFHFYISLPRLLPLVSLSVQQESTRDVRTGLKQPASPGSAVALSFSVFHTHNQTNVSLSFFPFFQYVKIVCNPPPPLYNPPCPISRLQQSLLYVFSLDIQRQLYWSTSLFRFWLVILFSLPSHLSRYIWRR